MKPVLRNVLLALGLLPMSVFADNAEERYEGQANITGMYGSQDSSYGEVDLWQPLWQAWDRVVFGDVRASKGNSASWESNVGGGYRWLALDEQFLFGAYSFYDYKNSVYNNSFQQLTFGGEIKTVEWTGRGNYYLPISAGAKRIYNNDSWQWNNANVNGYQNLLISKAYEYGLGGFDLEVGRLVPGVSGLTTYAGMFYFNNDDINEALVGPRLRAEYQVPFWINNVRLEGAWQYDEVRGNLWNIGLQIAIPFSRQSHSIANNDLRSRMNDYVRRDINVVTLEQNTAYKAYEKNGTVWNFANVNNSTQFNNDLNNVTQPNAYVIHGNIVAENGNIQLQDNMVLTGWKFEYENGHYFTLTNTMGSITAPANSDLFILGSNNTVRDLNLIVTQNAGEQPYSVLKNKNSNPRIFPNAGNTSDPSGLSVGALVIDNINAKGAVFIAVGDNTHDSNVTVKNSTFDMGGASGIDANINSYDAQDPYAGMDNSPINLEVWNNSSMTVNAVDNNTVNMGDNVNLGLGIVFLNNSATGTQTINSVSGNTVNIGENNLGAGDNTHGVVHGIYFANFGTQTIRSVNNNTVNIGTIDVNNNRHIHGIYFYNDYLPATQTITEGVNNNIVTFGDNAAVNNGFAIGIFIDNFGAQTMSGTVNNNVVTFGDNAGGIKGNLGIGYASGIEFDNCFTGLGATACVGVSTQTIASVNNNTVTFGDNAGANSGYAFGIYLDNSADSTQYTLSVNNNIISFGNTPGANGGSAYGFDFENDAGGISVMNGVTGNAVTGNPTYNIYIVNGADPSSFTLNINGAGNIAINGSTNQEAALAVANNGTTVYIDTVNGNDITMTE